MFDFGTESNGSQIIVVANLENSIVIQWEMWIRLFEEWVRKDSPALVFQPLAQNASFPWERIQAWNSSPQWFAAELNTSPANCCLLVRQIIWEQRRKSLNSNEFETEKRVFVFKLSSWGNLGVPRNYRVKSVLIQLKTIDVLAIDESKVACWCQQTSDNPVVQGQEDKCLISCRKKETMDSL